jgi:hypothetical protein
MSDVDLKVEPKPQASPTAQATKPELKGDNVKKLAATVLSLCVPDFIAAMERSLQDYALTNGNGKDPSKLLSQGKKKLILMNPHSPGDIVMMTAAVRDLHKTYPGEYKTDVDSPCPEIWEGNPNITRLDKADPTVVRFKAEYPIINNSNQGSYHFIHGYRKHLEEAIGRPIKQGDMKGEIFIRDEEKGWISAVQEITNDDRPFWIIDAGYKNDFTAKAWDFDRYQAVVDHFKDKIQFVQIGHKDHNHPDLKNCINMVGQTDLRQFIRLMYNAVGVLTPVSLPMTLAAAVPIRPLDKKYTASAVRGSLKNRPCVVISGGREPVQWQMYPHHQFLHTCGALECCDFGGCWKSRVKPLKELADANNKSLCLKPVHLPNGQDIGECMDLITAEDVIRSVERYYTPQIGVLRYDDRKTVELKYEGRKG